MADVEQKVRKYKKYLDKNHDRNVDNNELLSILRKLDRLDVTLEHLQTTGIGKSVNLYRKHDGGASEKVRNLISKWKDLVPIPAPVISTAVKCETVSETSYNVPVKQECDSTTERVRVPYMQPSRIQVYRDSVESQGYESAEKPVCSDLENPDTFCDSDKCDIECNSPAEAKQKFWREGQHVRSDSCVDDVSREDFREESGKAGKASKSHRQDKDIHRDKAVKDKYKDKYGDISTDENKRQRDKDRHQTSSRDKSEGSHGDRDRHRESSKDKSEKNHGDRNKHRGTSKDKSERGHGKVYAEDDEQRTSKYAIQDGHRDRHRELQSVESKAHGRSSAERGHGSSERKSTHSSSKHKDKRQDRKHDESALGQTEEHQRKVAKTNEESREKQEKHRDRERAKHKEEIKESLQEVKEKSGIQKDAMYQMTEELLNDIEEFEDSEDEPQVRQPESDSVGAVETIKSSDDQQKQVQKFVEVLKSNKRKQGMNQDGVLPKKLKSEPEDSSPAHMTGNEGFSFDDLMRFDTIKLKKHMKKKQKTQQRTSVSPAPSTSSNQNKSRNESSSKETHTKTSGSRPSSSKSDKKSRHHHDSKYEHSSGSHSTSDVNKSHNHHSSSNSRHGKESSSREKSRSSHNPKSSSGHGESKSTSSRHHEQKDHKSSSSHKESKSSSSSHKKSSSSSHKESNSTSKEEHRSSSKRKLLEPVDVPAPSKQVKMSTADIVGTLPEISPNYHPLPYPKPEALSKRNEITDHAAVSKNTRTQVYSGRKQVYLTAVPKLFDACMGVLKDNIDNLESVGMIPADILMPVLDRCNASQLYNLEEYNPHFIGDTEDCWEKLSQKDFKTATPGEFESWRELYLRMHDEREAKLKKLTANITVSHAKRNEPVRKTQLAYVDIAAKAPRGVRRQQMRHGTAGPKGQQDPLSRLTSHGRGENQAKAPIPRANLDIASSSPVSMGSGRSHQKQAKIVPPLMQKAKRMMKKYR